MKKWAINHVVSLVFLLIIALFAVLILSARTSTSSRLPQARFEPLVAASSSTCDLAREAILTGTSADIAQAMNALVADRTAKAMAREYARYYTGRDRDNNQLQEMDVAFIQMSCSS